MLVIFPIHPDNFFKRSALMKNGDPGIHKIKTEKRIIF